MTPDRTISARRAAARRGVLAVATLLGVAPIAPIVRAADARTGASAALAPAIVPNPLHEIREAGVFRLTAATRLQVPAREPGADRAAWLLRRWLRRSTGLRLAPPSPATPGRSSPSPAIRFLRRARTAIPREGYRLVVRPRGIAIEASSTAGWRYGVASLWQLIPARSGTPALPVPAVRIDDAPRWPVRALALTVDGDRPSPREIRRLNDVMAILKLNRLEWRKVRGAALDLDTRQSRAADEPPGLGRVLNLAEAYRATPAGPDGVRATAGTRGPRTVSQLERRLLPRAAALAEVGWSAPSRRHWRDFLRRLIVLERHARALGLHVSRAAFRVRTRIATDFHAATALVRLSTQTGYGTIRYTLAGGAPRADSARYRGPLRLRLPVTLRAADFAGGRRIGPILTRRLDLPTAQRRTSAQLSLCTERGSQWIEGAPSVAGVRTKFLVDAANPCWVYRAADLDVARRIRVAVGWVHFAPATNAASRAARTVTAPPRTAPTRAAGELVIRLDGCAGAPLASLALRRTPSALTVLPPLPLPTSVHGLHDLCVRLPPARRGGAWALAWIALEAPPPP